MHLNMLKLKKILLMLLIFLFIFQNGGCSGTKKAIEKTVQNEISIPMILTVDPSTGKKNEEEVVSAFNKTYDGVYQIEVDWIMETEDEYRKNLKRLNVTDKLPAIITDLRMLPSFYQMMIQEGRIEDLSPYINSDKEWKEMIEPNVISSFTEPDGSIYLAPLSTAAFSCSGIFWNEKLFQEAGILDFPQTWEEFWNCCDTLKSNNIIPLALHTEGTAWAPMLFATAELSASQSGAEYMKKLYPGSYQNKYGRRLASTLKKLFTYTTDDALHEDFDVAYTNFVSGRTAMTANGYWMIDQIPEKFMKNVRFSPFPENKLISSPETFGWAVVSSYDEKIKTGAVEFLKFRTKFNKDEKELFLNTGSLKKNQILTDYIRAYQNNPEIVPNYQVKWNSVLQEETLGEYIPKLVQEEITEQEFTKMEDESILQFKNEL